MQNKTAILEPEATYHIYNRANGQEKLFVSEENYHYFLQKYQEYISPIADTFYYCLMPNHFHFLLRIKNEDALKAIATLTGFKTLSGLAVQESISKYASRQFSDLFNGYTQAFNKQQGRKGSLFMRPFKRKNVTDSQYLQNLVRYIHCNPIEAGLCEKPEHWPHSSYSGILSGNHHFLKTSEVINWFEDHGNFQHIHSKKSMFEPGNL